MKGDTYLCRLCSYSTKTKCNYIKHTRTGKHTSKLRRLYCPCCYTNFYCTQALNKHLRKKLPCDVNGPTGDPITVNGNNKVQIRERWLNYSDRLIYNELRSDAMTLYDMSSIDILIRNVDANSRIFESDIDTVIISITESFIEAEDSRYRIFFMPSNSNKMIMGNNMAHGSYEELNIDTMGFIIRIIHNFNLIPNFEPTEEELLACIEGIKNEYKFKRADFRPYVPINDQELEAIIHNQMVANDRRILVDLAARDNR